MHRRSVKQAQSHVARSGSAPPAAGHVRPRVSKMAAAFWPTAPRSPEMNGSSARSGMSGRQRQVTSVFSTGGGFLFETGGA